MKEGMAREGLPRREQAIIAAAVVAELLVFTGLTIGIFKAIDDYQQQEVTTDYGQHYYAVKEQPQVSTEFDIYITPAWGVYYER